MSKKFEYVFGADGKVSDIIVEDKPVKRSSMRGFKKAQETPVFMLMKNPVLGRNPFSGAEVELNPLEGTIYHFCIMWYRNYERHNIITPIQTYDDMKYFLLEINPDAYMELLD